MADYYVTVCAECLTASCWHGEFMCQRSRDADVKTVRASELDAANHEHPGNYSRTKLLRVCGTVKEVRSD